MEPRKSAHASGHKQPPLVTRLTGHRQIWAEQRQLQAILDAAPYGCIALLPAGGALANAAAQGWLGRSIEDLADFLEPIADECRKALATAVDGLLREEQPCDLDVRCGGRILQVCGRSIPSDAGPLAVFWLEEVSERRRAESAASQALEDEREARERLQAMVETLPMPLWRRDARGALVWCNTAYCAALDTGNEAVLLGQREFATNQTDAGSRDLAQRAQETGEAQREERHVVIAGQRRLFAITECPLPGAGTLGSAIDVTDREAVEDDLSRQMESQAQVLEQLNTGIAIYDNDTRLRFYNGAWSNLFGIDHRFADQRPPLGEVLDRMYERRKLPEQADFRRFKQERLSLFTQLIHTHEELLHRQDGTTLRMLVVPYPSGGLIFVSEDVTDRLRLETSYNTMLAVQTETLNNLLEAVAVIGTDGRIKLWNPPFKMLWKLDPVMLDNEPHVSEAIDAMRPLLDDARPGAPAWETTRHQVSQLIFRRQFSSERLQRTDGKTIDFSVVPLPDGNALITNLDMTASVRMEQALRDRNAALEEADKLKLEFLANISYQLRTPLNAISGFAEILAHEYFGTLNERQQEYTTGIVEAGDRLLGLIDSILDLSTIEAGYMELDFQPTDLAEVFDQIAELAADWGRKQAIQVVMTPPQNTGPFLADAQRLRQILMNLISNSLKYTPAGGHIWVFAESDDQSVTVVVHDDGVGIAQEDQSRVLNAFERRPQGREDKGAGLGLTLVKSFVELHGGKLAIDSEPGAGTTIRCHLPRDPRAAPALPSTATGTAIAS